MYFRGLFVRRELCVWHTVGCEKKDEPIVIEPVWQVGLSLARLVDLYAQ